MPRQSQWRNTLGWALTKAGFLKTAGTYGKTFVGDSAVGAAACSSRSFRGRFHVAQGLHCTIPVFQATVECPYSSRSPSLRAIFVPTKWPHDMNNPLISLWERMVAYAHLTCQGLPSVTPVVSEQPAQSSLQMTPAKLWILASPLNAYV